MQTWLESLGLPVRENICGYLVRDSGFLYDSSLPGKHGRPRSYMAFHPTLLKTSIMAVSCKSPI